MARITWKGDEVRARMAAAAELAVEATAAECVRGAAADHPAFPPASEPGEPYANRTGFETGAIHSNPATLDGDRVAGTWGAYTAYSLFLEIGTSRAGSGKPTAAEREAAGAGNISAVPGPSEPPLMAPRPFLRPQADREYPLLGARIAAAYQGEPMP